MYILDFASSTKKELKKIDKQAQAFILDSLEDFVKNYTSEYEVSLMQTGRIKKLQGQKEVLYRLKLRSYRVIYTKYEDRLLILVVRVTSREGAYR